MTSMVYHVLLISFLLTCALVGGRERTVRRSFEIETDEQEFISSYDSFLEDVDGNNTFIYWPDGVNPFEEFGLMQKAMISDILLQLCIISGVYVRPPRNNNTVDPNQTTDPNLPLEKKAKFDRNGRSGLIDELLDLLRPKREAQSNFTTPPQENWEVDPYDILEDAEDQFSNLCFTLFELRRLNRKLARERNKTTTTTTTTAPTTTPTTTTPAP